MCDYVSVCLNCDCVSVSVNAYVIVSVGVNVYVGVNVCEMCGAYVSFYLPQLFCKRQSEISE